MKVCSAVVQPGVDWRIRRAFTKASFVAPEGAGAGAVAAGFGVAVVSPLGPIGIDLGYGFDRTNLALQPDPGWQLHFRLGNFF